MNSYAEETITPDLAQNYLDSGENIRTLAKGEVLRLAGIMEKNKFRPDNGETIKFSDSGALVDGQHRLAAQVRSGKTYTYLVVRGVPKPVVDITVDQGKVRSAGAILGASGVKNSAVVGNLAYWYYYYNLDERPNRRSTIEMFLNFAKTVPGVEEAAVWGMRVGRHIALPSGQAALLHLLASQAGRREEAEDFLNKLATGVGLEDKGDPILVLRDRLLNKRGGAGVLPPEDKFTMFVKAWNMSFQGLNIAGRGLNPKAAAGQEGAFPKFLFHK